LGGLGGLVCDPLLRSGGAGEARDTTHSKLPNFSLITVAYTASL